VRVNKENEFWIKGYLIFAGFPENKKTEENWKLILPEVNLIIKCPLALFFHWFGIYVCFTSVTSCSSRSSRDSEHTAFIVSPWLLLW